MTITVEDGTGLTTADAYTSVAAVDTYFSNRNNTTWTGSTAVKEAAIRKATAYLDATYTWIGKLGDTTQSLGWPRTGAYDKEGRDLSDSVPTLVAQACAELALVSLSSELISDLTNTNFVKREKVGSLEVEYMDSAPANTNYQYVDRLLSALYTVKAGSGNARAIR